MEPLTLRQYQLLNEYADGPCPIYYAFARVNFGGQVFPGSSGPRGRSLEDERTWSIVVHLKDLVVDLVLLVGEGYLACKVEGPASRLVRAVEVREEDFSIYGDYDCVTIDDHVDRFGGGPHYFETTEKGLAEIAHERYIAFDKELGW